MFMPVLTLSPGLITSITFCLKVFAFNGPLVQFPGGLGDVENLVDAVRLYDKDDNVCVFLELGHRVQGLVRIQTKHGFLVMSFMPDSSKVCRLRAEDDMA